MALQRLTHDVHNAASGTVDGTVAVAATTCTLATGSGLIGTETPFLMAVWEDTYANAALAKVAGKYEIVAVTAISGANVTAMTRGYSGTSDIEWDTTGGQTWQWDVVIDETMWRQVDTLLDNALDQQVGWIDPSDSTYGAAFDGATDDTAAWTAAIAAANTAGKEIRCPAGTSIIDSATVADGISVRIVGQGQGNTILKQISTATDGMFKNITTPGLVRFELESLTIDGNSTADRDTRPIWLWVDYFKCRDVEFKNTVKAAISLVNIDEAASIDDCWFHSMAVHSNTAGQDTGAILVGKTAANTSGLRVHGCVFEAAAPSANAGECPYGIVINCGEGFDQSSWIEGNRFENIGQELQANSSAAIHCYEGGNNGIIRNNVFDLAAGECIRWQKSDNVIIENNIVTGEATSIASATNGVISIENRTTNEVNRRFRIAGNIVAGCASFAQCLYATWATSLELTDLEICGNQFDGCDKAVELNFVTGFISIHHNVFRNQTGASGEKVLDIKNLDEVSSEPAFINISSNVFTDQTERCIFIDAETAQDVAVVIRDNHFENIAPVAAGYVVHVDFCRSVKVSGNHFASITGATGGMTILNVADTLEVGSVLDFGAAGDGSQDDTTHIQAAIDAFEDFGGGTIFFPAGDYLTGEVIIDAPFVHLRGERGTKLTQAAAAANVIEIRDTTDIKVQDLEFVGVGGDGTTSTSNDNGVRIRSNAGTPALGDVARVHVKDCVFRDFRFMGVMVGHADDVLLENCFGYDLRDAFGFYACRNSEMRGCVNNGNMLAEASGNLASGFHVGMNYTGAANTFNSSNIRIIDCVAKDRNNSQSFLIHSGIGITVQGCVVENGIMGIYVVPAAAQTNAVISDVVVDGCRVELRDTSTAGASPGNNGITIGGNSAGATTHLERAVISNCIVTGGNKGLDSQGYGGIFLSSYTRDMKIVSCSFDDCRGVGIVLGGSNHDRFQISGCTVSNVVAGGGGNADEGCGVKLRNTVGSTSNGTIKGLTIDDCVEGLRTSETASSVVSYGHTFQTISGNDYEGTFGVLSHNEPVAFSKGIRYPKNSVTLATAQFAITGPGWYEMTSETGPTDTLDSVTGGTAGDIIILTGVTGDTITVSVAGNFKLGQGAGSFVMDPETDVLIVMYDGTNWLRINNANNIA